MQKLLNFYLLDHYVIIKDHCVRSSPYFKESSLGGTKQNQIGYVSREVKLPEIFPNLVFFFFVLFALIFEIARISVNL